MWKIVDAAANLEWLGLDLRHMNRGGQNHVTYYEPEKKKRKGGARRRERQRGGNIMDKGSNEAEKGEVARDRRGQGGGRRRGRRQCTVGVERRRGGGRGREERECASLPAFSHAPSVLLRQTEAARERWRRGLWDRGRKNTGDEEEMRVVRPVRQSKGAII